MDSNIYTPDEINEMTGAYKEKLNAELVAAATAARQKEICDSLGIAVEDVTFVGITRMICTLTPEQIHKAAESDWLYKGITLREEFVSSDDLGLVTTAPADEITTTETSAVTTASSTEANCNHNRNFPHRGIGYNYGNNCYDHHNYYSRNNCNRNHHNHYRDSSFFW